jgi:hypothetical protein
MDRWGFSEDCAICGQPVSVVDFVYCPVCEKTMCGFCLEHNHDCHDVYSVDDDEE